jgi:hypothetical protein
MPTGRPFAIEFIVQSITGRDVNAIPLTLVPVRNFLRTPIPEGIEVPQR